MEIFKTVAQTVANLSDKEFKRYTIGVISIVFICASFLIYRHARITRTLTQRITYINQQREELETILKRYNQVAQQKKEINTLLQQDKDFKIKDYFEKVLKTLNIEQNSQRNPEISQQELENGYVEIKLFANLTNMNMKQLIDLLDTFEKKPRIYTKELEIYTPNQTGTITINILIATLEPQMGS